MSKPKGCSELITEPHISPGSASKLTACLLFPHTVSPTKQQLLRAKAAAWNHREGEEVTLCATHLSLPPLVPTQQYFKARGICITVNSENSPPPSNGVGGQNQSAKIKYELQKGFEFH